MNLSTKTLITISLVSLLASTILLTYFKTHQITSFITPTLTSGGILQYLKLY